MAKEKILITIECGNCGYNFGKTIEIDKNKHTNAAVTLDVVCPKCKTQLTVELTDIDLADNAWFFRTFRGIFKQ